MIYQIITYLAKGAIANETGLDSREIGQIDIKNTFSLVEVSHEAAQDVISALKGVTIRGHRLRAKIDEKSVASVPYQRSRSGSGQKRRRQY